MLVAVDEAKPGDWAMAVECGGCGKTLRVSNSMNLDSLSDQAILRRVGKPILAVLIMLLAVLYWAAFVGFLAFVWIPFQCVKGLINPDIPAWDQLFGGRDWSLDLPSRTPFIVLLTFYLILYATIAFVTLDTLWS